MKGYLPCLRSRSFVLTVILLLFTMAGKSVCKVPEQLNSDNFKLLRLHYANSSGEEGITDFEYDAFGNLVFSRWKLLNGERNSLNRYELNQKGDVVRKHRIFSDSLRSSTEFTYDPIGNLSGERWNRSDGISGKVDYHYNEKGVLQFETCLNMNGWLTGRINYLYNSYDVIYEAHIQRGDERIGKITFQYDINGNLVSEKWYFNGNWAQTFRYEYVPIRAIPVTSANPYIRSSPFYRVAGEYYDFNGEISGPSEYSYVDGMLNKKIFNRSDGLTTKTSYQYDEIGRLKRGTRLYSDGMKAEFFYEFDSTQRMVRRWFNRSDGLKGEEKYQYDREGRLMMAEFQNMDAWLSGTVAFSHNDQGLPVKGYFKGMNGFDAEIYFFYDEYKNLVKVSWEFSSGNYQTYTFEYASLYQKSREQTASF